MADAEREIMVGKNRIYLDDDSIIHFINVGDIDEKDALEAAKAMGKLNGLAGGKANFLIDLNRGGKLTSEAKKILKDFSENTIKGKLGFWGLSALPKLLASIFMTVTKKSDMSFFETREQAVAWLKEPKQAAR